MRMLVVGDAMTDVYHVGAITRLNPEDHSVPLVSIHSTMEFPGGAANVARNLASLGVDVVLVSGSGPTIKKHRVVDSKTVCRFDEDYELQPIMEEDLLEVDFDGIVVSDYSKGSIDDLHLPKWLRAKYPGAPIFVDTKKDPGRWLDHATCLFPNDLEYSKHKYAYNQAKLILKKSGSQGATLLSLGQKRGVLASQAELVLNQSGAGDTVIAAFSTAYVALGSNLSIKKAAYFSMQAAALAVANKYTHAPTIEQIMVAFPSENDLHSSIKTGLTISEKTTI